MGWFNKGRVKVDQSNARIAVDHVENLNVSQIGGTINNGTAANNQQTRQNQTGQGESIAIGVTGDEMNVFDVLNDIFGDD